MTLVRLKCVFCAVAVWAALFTAGCTDPANAPRTMADYEKNAIYSSFSGRSPKTLDPQVSYSSDETLYTYSVYEPLLGYHYLKRPYEIVPKTAEAVPEPQYLDAKGEPAAPGEAVAFTRYRFMLKPGIRFAPHPAFARDESGAWRYHRLSDEVARNLKNPLDLPYAGTRELVAEDYVYGIKRLADPRVVSPALSVLSAYLPGLKKLSEALRRDVEAARSAGGPMPDLRRYELDGVRALDERTLEITIAGRYPAFLNWLTMTFFAPVPWEAEAFYSANPLLKMNGVTLAAWPVGTGPYRLVVSRANREHVLERNPLFRTVPYPCEGEPGDREKGLLEDCGKPVPFADRIVMTMEKEAVPVTSKFLQGYYDSPQISRVDTGQGFLVAAADSAEKAALYAERELMFPETVEANLWYLGFNWLDPVVGAGKTPEEDLRHRKLRQAISIAIDWEEEIAIFAKEQGEASHGPLPPGLFGWRADGPAAFNPVAYRRDEAGRIVRRPIEDARRLMREAGYPDGRDAATGRPLVLNFDWQGAAASSKAFLEWFSRQFAKIGIQLEIRATDYNRFQDKMNRGVAQIYYWGWIADYPDPENFLSLLYGPNSKALGTGGENASNYRNARYDALFEKMRTMAAGDEKQALIDEMIWLVQEDAPWSFGYSPKEAAALHRWVKNAKPTQTVRDHVQYLRVDAAERTERIRRWNQPVLWPVVPVAALLALFVWGMRQLCRRRQQATGRGGEI